MIAGLLNRESSKTDSAIPVSSPWYRTLTREQWRVLLASNLGGLFDGFEIAAPAG
jgi:hypothetical protein